MDKPWKKFERKVARFFGTERKALSGSAGQKGQTRSDSYHPDLYIECKYTKGSHAAINLWRDADEKADVEGKTPMVCLRQANTNGFLICIHSDDLSEVVEILSKRA